MFTAKQPLEVDVGCGKGKFLFARARQHPETNYLGIDRLLGRLRKIDKKITSAGLANVRLLRIEASYAIQYLLPAESVSVVYIFFPDPWPKRRHQRRRLFNRLFLDSLNKILLPGALIHIATDHSNYFDFIHELLRADPRFDSIPPMEPTEEEQTNFETLFRKQNLPINRCSFQKKKSPDIA